MAQPNHERVTNYEWWFIFAARIICDDLIWCEGSRPTVIPSLSLFFPPRFRGHNQAQHAVSWDYPNCELPLNPNIHWSLYSKMKHGVFACDVSLELFQKKEGMERLLLDEDDDEYVLSSFGADEEERRGGGNERSPAGSTQRIIGTILEMNASSSSSR